MKLQSLQLNNFRQFYGKSPVIVFAGDRDRNVTVIHGCNGAGKTALLNAFTWVLYGAFTRGFLFADRIVNNRAIREAKGGETVEAWVELRFEDDSRRYILRKTAQVLRTQDEPGWTLKGEAVSYLQWAGDDGKWNSEDAVGDVVGRILPQDLHTYFFFDGERIERLVQPEKRERADMASATKKLLGIEILDRAERHLGSAKKELERELKSIGDPETVRLLNEKSSLEMERTKIDEEQGQIAIDLDGHRQRIAALEGRLRDLKEVASFQQRRDQLNSDLKSRRETLGQSKEELSSLVSARAYSVFLDGAAERFRAIIEELRQRGELPAGIKRQFVEDLLKRGQCICGRSLNEHNEPHSRREVEIWMQRAGLQDVEEKAIRMGGEVKHLQLMVQEFWERVDQIQQKRQADRSEISRIEDELDAIKTKLSNSPTEEISGIQRKLDDAMRSIDELNIRFGVNTGALRSLDNKILEIQEAITKHRANEAKQALAQARVSHADEAIRRIVRMRSLIDSSFRKELVKRVRKLFDTMSYTPYYPDIADDYSLRLLDSSGGSPLPVAASQGENQILSLAYIGSIIGQAREYHAKKERLPGPDSSTFPVVMDSPFGSLGPTYRRQIADHIPRLADQLVLMVTNTQWRGEVEQSMAGRIGRSYVLRYFTPKENAERDSVEIKGVRYELIEASPNEYEYTQIMEAADV